MAPLHPLDPCTSDEISITASIIKAAFPKSVLDFRVIDLNEPPKAAVLDYLAAEEAGSSLPYIARITKTYFTRKCQSSFLTSSNYSLLMY